MRREVRNVYLRWSWKKGGEAVMLHPDCVLGSQGSIHVLTLMEIYAPKKVYLPIC